MFLHSYFHSTVHEIKLDRNILSNKILPFLHRFRHVWTSATVATVVVAVASATALSIIIAVVVAGVVERTHTAYQNCHIHKIQWGL